MVKEENKLALIINDSGLEPAEGKSILEKFDTYEQIAKDWEIKAKAIVVSNESQIAEMKMAREGRLFLAQKRIDVEKARKAMKEQSLRKGQAIDAIAKFLTSLIEPTEKYLKEQEDFVAIRRKREEEAKRIEEEKRLEEERIAKEEADRVEQERIRQENIKLRAEMEIKEKQLAEERIKQEEILRKQRLEHERERKVLELRATEEREAKEKAEKALKNTIRCPYCNKEFNSEGTQ